MYGAAACIDKSEQQFDCVIDRKMRFALIRFGTLRDASTNFRSHLELFLSLPRTRRDDTGVIVMLGNGQHARSEYVRTSCADSKLYPCPESRTDGIGLHPDLLQCYEGRRLGRQGDYRNADLGSHRKLEFRHQERKRDCRRRKARNRQADRQDHGALSGPLLFGGRESLEKVVRRDRSARSLNDEGQDLFFRKPAKSLVPVYGLTRDADPLTEVFVRDFVCLEVSGELHAADSVTVLVTRQASRHQFGYLALSPIR